MTQKTAVFCVLCVTSRPLTQSLLYTVCLSSSLLYLVFAKGGPRDQQRPSLPMQVHLLEYSPETRSRSATVVAPPPAAIRFVANSDETWRRLQNCVTQKMVSRSSFTLIRTRIGLLLLTVVVILQSKCVICTVS